MTYTIETAKRQATPVLVSVAGRSGSGKTLSSLLIAKGLAGGDMSRVVVVDTENKRSRLYADDPDVGGFKVLDLYPPFSSGAYIAALDAVEKAEPLAVVLDSTSHEWTGIGGCLEQAEEIERKTGKKGPNAWVAPKMAHHRFVNRLLMAQCHVICGLRAEFKKVATQDERGKQTFAESTDLIPEQEKRFVYEMTCSAVLDLGTNAARWVKLPKPLAEALPSGHRITVATGNIIREWVNGGQAIDRELEALKASGRDSAAAGTAGLVAWWSGLGRDLQTRLSAFKNELKPIAAAADAQALALEEEAAGNRYHEDDEGGAL